MQKHVLNNLRSLTDQRLKRIVFPTSSKKRCTLTRYITSVFFGCGLCISVVSVDTYAYAKDFDLVTNSRHNHLLTIYAQTSATNAENQAETDTDAQPENASDSHPLGDFLSEIDIDNLITLVIGTLIGGFLKWGLEQWGFRRATKRQFAQAVTDQISKLAGDHYWSLANYAGVVAGLLEDYIEQYSYRLILVWDNKDDLRKELDTLAEDAVRTCFPYFCHLIGLFYAFQFKEGNTYLLTDHRAGETCKQLYNTFLQSFSDSGLSSNFADFYALEIHSDSLKAEREYSDKQNKISDNNASKEDISQAKETKRIYEILPADLTERVIEKYEALNKGRQLWHQWLRHDLASVIKAADALRAYNELLNHELAGLYRDWFNNKRGIERWVTNVTNMIYGPWPKIITEQSEITIQHVSLQSVLLSPLGAAVSEAPKVQSASFHDTSQTLLQETADYSESGQTAYSPPSSKANLGESTPPEKNPNDFWNKLRDQLKDKE